MVELVLMGVGYWAKSCAELAVWMGMRPAGGAFIMLASWCLFATMFSIASYYINGGRS